ncbi:hypothetical protein OEB99_17030 [Actinotalea sp. M2MS4P-6]|uniref:hypothetical protein n=1 Tax=Actinotalea sp. M2MS4P-6 TaxID=2983762 RepID=UPI0021E38BE4|nr:hypothetical protein [Actinotalea sp. M2MS4P-6]MCV2396020.1 hypothetical protein [Actinotalea sp. M2MS4P-6]
MKFTDELVKTIEPVISDPGLSTEDKTRELNQLRLPGRQVINEIWRVLVYTAAGLAVISMVGILVAVLDGNDATAPDVLIGLFTTSFAGLLGLVLNPNQES